MSADGGEFAKAAEEFRQARERREQADRQSYHDGLNEPKTEGASGSTRINPGAVPEFLSYSEMIAMPEPGWLIKGLLMRTTSALLFGPSNSFKSFMAIDVACCIGTGRSWHGNPVTHPGPVLYVATEGGPGIGRLRVPGWMDAHNIPAEDREKAVFLYPQEISLDDDAAVDLLLTACANNQAERMWSPVETWTQKTPAGSFRLVVIDIFGASMSGPETSDETARPWVRNLNRIMREVGCAVLVVAHTGWATELRARMHTHFWGSFDTRLKAEGDKAALTTSLTVDRHKDADSTGTWGFRMTVVPAIAGNTTLVPLLADDVKAGQGRRASGKPAVALQALSEALIDKGRVMVGPSYPSCPVVHVDEWGEMCRRHGLTDADTAEARKKAFQRAKDALLVKGLVRQFDHHVWKTSADV